MAVSIGKSEPVYVDSFMGIDEDAIYGQVGMLHISITGQVRQLAQIALLTHKISCQSVAMADALPDNQEQVERAKTLRRITEELQVAIEAMGLQAEDLFK
jgi:hypothetical protein